MTEHERNRKARDYIDSVVELNRDYGADPKLPADVYRKAIEEAANAFKGLQPLQPLAEPSP